MAHTVEFFVQPRFGIFEINFFMVVDAGIAGEPWKRAVLFPTLDLMRESLVSVGLPATLAAIGKHPAIEVSRDKLRSIGFDMD